MQIVRAVFERGVELRFTGDHWRMLSARPGVGVIFDSPKDAAVSLSPLRQLLVTDKRDFGGDVTFLLRPAGGEFFGVCVSDLMNRSLSADMLYPVYHLSYLLGAVSYHCQRLAEIYAQIAVRFCEITQIPGHDNSKDVANFGYQTEPSQTMLLP
jgi:hypothetical protein